MQLKNGILGFLLVLFLNLNVVLGEIRFYQNTSTTNAVYSAYSIELVTKGSAISENGKWVYIAKVQPEDACNAVEPATKNAVSGDHEWFALVRYKMADDCSHQVKAKNLIAAGFDGAILFKQPSSGELEKEDSQELTENDETNSDVLIPLLLITPRDGLEIEKRFTYEKGYLAFIGVQSVTVTIKAIPIIVIIIAGGIAVLLGLCICGAVVRMLLNLNKK